MADLSLMRNISLVQLYFLLLQLRCLIVSESTLSVLLYFFYNEQTDTNVPFVTSFSISIADRSFYFSFYNNLLIIAKDPST